MADNELVIIEEVALRDYPKFDLALNKVKVFKGVEFNIDDFTCLQMLENHNPAMVQMVSIQGQNVNIYYLDGSARTVTLNERLVLWEKYTEWLIDERARLYKNLPVEAEPEEVKRNMVIEVKCTVVDNKKLIE